MNTKLFITDLMLLLTIYVLNIDTIDAQDNEIDDLLKLNILNLMDVEVVSATKTLQKISEVPATVRVIKSETIKENNYFTLEDALSDLPGFQFRNIIGFNSYIFQRGVTNQNNLILLLVDGIQINELNSGGFYGGGQFNLENVERIEVVYGPASTLYGTNAISGIINIITKSPEQHQGFDISALYGSFNTINGNIGYGWYHDEKQIGFRFSGMYKTSEKGDLAGVKGDNNWTDEMENYEDDYSFDVKLKFKEFTLGTNFQNKMSSRTTNYKSIGTNYIDRNTIWNIMFLNSYMSHSYSLSNEINIRSRVYYRNTTVLDNTIGYILDTTQIGYYRPNNLIGAEGIVAYNPEKTGLSCIGGIVLENENLADGFSRSYSGSLTEKPPAPEKPEMLNNTLLSIYLQGQYKLFNTVNFIVGGRFDNSTNYNQVLSPRFGIVYHKEKFTSKVLYTEAFRAPKPWDYNSGIGNSDLQPEKVQSLEIASAYSLFESIQLNVSYYRNLLSDIISREDTAQSYRWVNKGKLTTDGFEININFRKEPISSYVNYTYNSSRDENGNIIPEIAEHYANAGIRFGFDDHLKIGIRGNYLGKRKNPKIITATGKNIIEPAFVIHANLSYFDFYGFDFQLMINNLLNQKYYHSSNRPPERYRQPQRCILLKCSYKLKPGT